MKKRKKQAYALNHRRKEAAEKAADLMTLLSALPSGQVKNLLKDPTCGPILEKYGVKGA